MGDTGSSSAQKRNSNREHGSSPTPARRSNTGSSSAQKRNSNREHGSSPIPARICKRPSDLLVRATTTSEPSQGKTPAKKLKSGHEPSSTPARRSATYESFAKLFSSNKTNSQTNPSSSSTPAAKGEFVTQERNRPKQKKGASPSAAQKGATYESFENLFSSNKTNSQRNPLSSSTPLGDLTLRSKEQKLKRTPPARGDLTHGSSEQKLKTSPHAKKGVNFGFKVSEASSSRLSRAQEKRLEYAPGAMKLTAEQKRKFGRKKGKKNKNKK